MTRGGLLLSTASLLVGACGNESSSNTPPDAAVLVTTDGSVPAPAPSDAGAEEDAAPAEVPLAIAIGTGEPGSFVPPREGDVLRLQRGCQGSQHVFTSIRARGVRSELLRVTVTIARVDDGAVISVPLDVRLPVEADPWSDAARRITGLTPVVEAPREALEREVEVLAVVSDDAGRTARASMRGVVQWGEDSCGGH